jgi:TP901 family phage tail tape measure protein
VNFVSSITLQFRDLFSQGMAQARTGVTQLQSSLNDINPGGLAGLSASAIALPVPEIGQPVIPMPDALSIDIPTPDIGRPDIPMPDTPLIDIATPEIGRPDIPMPDTPLINIPIPEIGQPVIPIPDTPGIDIPIPEIGRPVIPTPDIPPINFPTPGIPQPAIPAPDTSLFKQGLEEIQAGLDKIAENSALNTLATQLSVMNMAMGPVQRSLNTMMEQPSKLAASFESSMKNIQAITGNSNEEMAVLNRQLLDIGKNAVAGPQGVVDAMNDIAGGVDNAESHLGILNGAVLLAEAGQADLGVAANGLVSIMNAYSLASGDAASATENAVTVSDVLTQTVGQGVGSMEAFITAFSQVSGLSASVGVGFDEVGAALAFITTQGPSASEAATQLKAAETALLNPNETLSKALQSVGIASGSAMLAEYGLVESLGIVKRSVDGSQDAMAKALGSTMALNGATALLGSGYTDFAAKFGAALESGVTAEAAAIQNQSYESKLARMEAATAALRLQIGDNINAIKGRFVDMGAGFLTNVVSPIMSSPIGGVFQEAAAVAGVAGQGLLSFGGAALSTATQFTTLAANIKNAGGYAEIFHGMMTVMQAPFKAVGSSISGMVGPLIAKTTATFAATAAEVGFAGAMWATAGAMWAATWPILAVVAAVALVAGGVYLLIKNWDAVSAFFVGLWNKVTGAFSAAFDWIRNRLAGVSDWVLAAVAVFLPFIGIPALIIKHWDTIAAFFVGLWTRITGWAVSAWGELKNFFSSLWNSIVSTFTNVWNAIPGFFASLWNSITSIVATVAAWLSSVWQTVAGAFSLAWTWASNVFTSVWNGITGVVAGVANWFGEVFGSVAGTFAAAWTWVSDLFTSIWEGMKGVVTGFVEWLSPVVDMIIAPFRAIGNTIGGIIGSVKGWFGETVEIGKTELAIMNENKMKDAASGTLTIEQRDMALGDSRVATALGLNNTAPAPGMEIASPVAAAPAFTATSAASTPPLAAPTATASSGGSSLAMEHIEAARRKGVAASDISYAAASAFENAGAYTPPVTATGAVPAIDWQQTAMTAAGNRAASSHFLESLPVTATASPVDVPDIDRETRVTFAEAMPARREAVTTNTEREDRTDDAPRQNIFHIANMNFNADELRTLFDFVHQLELAVMEPEAVTV